MEGRSGAGTEKNIATPFFSQDIEKMGYEALKSENKDESNSTVASV